METHLGWETVRLLVIIEGMDLDKISYKGVYMEKTADKRELGE